jgi:hypothetical protein
MRRLKCGEERPECYRCQKSGWRCDRYDTPPPRSKSPVPVQPYQPASLSIYAPSGFPNLDAEEQKYFQIYLDQTPTTLEVQGATSLFWKRVVLQESYFNECVRHALVAIGAVAKSAHTRLRWAYLINPLDSTQETHRRYVDVFLRIVFMRRFLLTLLSFPECIVCYLTDPPYNMGIS